MVDTTPSVCHTRRISLDATLRSGGRVGGFTENPPEPGKNARRRPPDGSSLLRLLRSEGDRGECFCRSRCRGGACPLRALRAPHPSLLPALPSLAGRGRGRHAEHLPPRLCRAPAWLRPGLRVSLAVQDRAQRLPLAAAGSDPPVEPRSSARLRRRGGAGGGADRCRQAVRPERRPVDDAPAAAHALPPARVAWACRTGRSQARSTPPSPP